eukprot:CAMPEP_0174366502 /NCGR_PEP_ID=MMETSP0811_2-20130205/81440_1 /TAXON_ID=73025 ORGANISM="Eutreptiella gymnastica-like, Strain CCMP1594" /NCGR_SAMPLE_ID=MMETSP0811_2 /ASSEMBLY_ACC=CAM_ASM_000667 /LENGTH=59 /DNA_ID=CAMNT_0015508123 /DNA_START=20 /DNA_END=195 /DNA_ORIENTATION=+
MTATICDQVIDEWQTLGTVNRFVIFKLKPSGLSSHTLGPMSKGYGQFIALMDEASCMLG